MQGRETAEQITGSVTKADLWQLLGVVIKNTECFSYTFFYVAYYFKQFNSINHSIFNNMA
jgi:hypothetical protein